MSGRGEVLRDDMVLALLSVLLSSRSSHGLDSRDDSGEGVRDAEKTGLRPNITLRHKLLRLRASWPLWLKSDWLASAEQKQKNTGRSRCIR